MLALRVSLLCNVVRNAAITAITKAVAKIANTVRLVSIFKVPTPWGNSEIALSNWLALRPLRISEQAVEFLFANGIALARALFDPNSI
jgi:hypothetical protein